MPVSLSNPTLSPNSPAANVLGWLKQAMGLPTAELHIKLRGNILHVLCETSAALDQSAVLLKLVRSLLEGGDDLVRQHYPQVYQLYVYSRLTGNPTPAWTAPIYLNRLERHLAQLVLENQDEADIKATQSLLEKYNQGQSARGAEGGSGAIVMSNLSLARKGDPEAIAWYLSETLSSLDVGVWVSIKAIPGTAHLHRMAIALDDGDPAKISDPAGTDTTISRLWILCEATYSPDPSLIARPTAERLRQLQLTQFKDAVLLLQVRGETKPDWSLRIDLTPPEEMLREWGRWGDTDAIARLLSAAVASWHLGVTAELTNGTLHLICSPQSGDHDTQQAEGLAAQEAVLEALTTPLSDLAPQGIPRAVIYGQAGADATPAWVHYLDLPAAEHSALADTPEYLGQTGDLPAIAFLLTRLLNPSLDDRLATGGQRVQLLRRDGLLHVMVDGPVAPRRRLVAPPINDYLHSLSPMGIEGVRIYGRRSGQSQPAWTFGQDFLARRRLVPEATPEFTASDSYVNELLVRPDGPVTAAEIEAELEEDVALSQWVQDVLSQGRHLLLRSQLLTSATPDRGDGVESLDDLGRSDGFKIAVVWAAVGILVALQVDWLLGQIITPVSQQAKAEDIAPIPTEAPPASDPLTDDLAELDWPGSQSSDNGWGEGGFTSDSNGDSDDIGGAQSLDTSPSQPIVAIDDLVEQASFSSFNSDQMNEKLALYYQRLEQSGPPDVMIVGSSRALRGVDPVALRQELATIGYENVSVFNFGINGATAQVVDLVIRQVLEPDQLPQLIIWADGARAFNSGRVDATYNAIAASPGYREVASRRAEAVEVAADPANPAAPGSPEMPTGSLPKSYAAMDEWLSGRLATVSAVYADRDRLKGWFQQRLMAAAPAGSSEEALDAAMPEGSTIDYDGFLALSVRFNPATYYQDFARVSGRYDGDYDSFRLEGQQVEAFANLLGFTQEQGIPIVFINTPLTDEYLDDYRQDAEAEFLQHMLRLSTTETGFLFRDFAQLWPDRYDYFSDPSHLNRYGAYQVSSQLGQDPLIAWPRPAAPPAPPALP